MDLKALIYFYLLGLYGVKTVKNKLMVLANRIANASAGGAFVLVCAMLFLCAMPGFSQLPSNLRTQYFPSDNGISNNAIVDFAQDQNGFLWLATGNGLNRFDGRNYKVFKKNLTDPNSLLDNSIMKVAVDRNNRIWIGYRAHGLSCYDQVTGNFKHFLPDSTQPESFPWGETSALFIDSDNILWFAAGKNGLHRMDIATGKVESMGDLPFLDSTKSKEWRKYYNLVSEIIEGGDTLWMATADGLYSFDKKSRSFQVYRFEGPGVDYNTWKPDVFHAIVRTSPKDFYLGGWGRGLNHYDAELKKWTNFLIRPEENESNTFNIIGRMQQKSKDEIWVTSYDTTISVFNVKENVFYHLNQEQINNNHLSELGGIIFTDFSGDLWIGLPSGLYLINQSDQKFHFTDLSVTKTDNGRNHFASSLFNDTVSGSLLVGTAYADGLHVYRQDGSRKIIPYQTKPGSSGQFGADIFMDSRSNIWVISSDAVQLYNRQTEQLITPPQPVPDTAFKSAPSFHKAVEDPSGRIWFATFRHGVYRFDPGSGKWTQFFSHPDGRSSLLPGNYITDIAIDLKGDAWICHDRQGVTRIRFGSDKAERYISNPGDRNTIPDNRTLCAETDKKGRVWLGTFFGLSFIDPSTEPPLVNNFVHDDNFLGMLIYDMLIDNHQRIWTMNSNGVSVLDYEKKVYRTFGYEQGLPKTYQALHLSRGIDDLIYGATWRGYFTFSDTIATTEDKPQKVSITSFSVGNKSINFEYEINHSGMIKMYSGEDLFAAEFISIHFKNPNAITYQYRLKGLDDEWKSSGNRGFVSYNNLPGGSYTLELQANLAGEFSDITTIPIFIETPFYKSSWFRLLLIASFAGLIFSLYRYRVSHIEKTEALKTELNKQIAETEMKALRAQMNPHFIFNCLNSINRYIIKNDHKTASLYLTKFAKLIRLILDNSEHHEVELSQELEALKLYIDIEGLRFDHKFSYEIEVDDEIDQDSIKIPAMVIQPFVENAIWHGLLHKDTHGKMMIRVKLEGELLVCEVEDDGVGREKAMELKSKTATTRKSLGLKITADRLEALESRFGVPGSVEFIDLKNENGEASGTKVVIKIPVEV